MRFTEEYENYCKEFTDAPEIFHRFCAYFLISCVLGRKAYIPVGDYKVFANLWMVIVAPSSFYHKSTSVNIARRILDHVNEEFAYPNEFSHEKLLQVFEKQPEGAFFFDEIASLLGMLGKDYNRAAEAMFTTLYGGGKYKRITGVKEEHLTVVRDPYINIIGASTIPWLVGTVTESSMTGGFLPRFVFIPATSREKIFPFPVKADNHKMNQLISILGTFSGKSGEANLTKDAIKTHESWYLAYVKRHENIDRRIQPFLSRLADDYILKLALIISVDRNEFPTITAQTIEESKATVEFLANSFMTVLADELGTTPFQRQSNRVISIIRDNHGEPVKLETIYRKTRFHKRDMENIIQTLLESGLIAEVTIETTGRYAKAFVLNSNGSHG